jgi:MFS family permease
MATKALGAYAAVTAAYWAFMLTDGALRMLVLLHFNGLGFSPILLAWLFLLYEVAGIVTNLSAGYIAARYGLATTLYVGLLLQILALCGLAMLDVSWGIAASVTFVMLVQGLSGVAKDLAKMSSKSAVKLLAPSDDGGLFQWVALLTGSKNAVKGFGFLLGAGLLAIFGFHTAIWGMAIILAVILLAVVLLLPTGLPQGKKGVLLSSIWSSDTKINGLSLARMFLFCARDVWFVVGVPIYFQSVLSDGSPDSRRAAFFVIGTFMAVWTIGYGIVQGFSPKILAAGGKSELQIVKKATFWAGLLMPIPLVLAGTAYLAAGPSTELTVALMFGLLVFGFVFAVNSSVHSYLILAFSRAERVTMDVGFYYMANAVGRLFGTLLSGISYQLGGLVACLVTAGVMTVFSYLAMRRLTNATALAQ